jgi:zinc protease
MYARALLVLCCIAPLLAHAGPKIEHWTLDNGTRVYFARTAELPMLQVRAVFDAASARDPKEKRGLAKLTNSLLLEGAGSMNVDDIAARFADLGAEVGANSARDMATVDLRTLTSPDLIEPAIELFATILATPTFPQSGLERERQQVLVALAHEAQSPGDVADNALMRLLYGGHPYANNPLGERSTLEAITRDDLMNHHRRYYVGRNLWLVLVGDLDLDKAKRISEKLAGQLDSGEPAPALPVVSLLKAPRVEKISFPAGQSHIMTAQHGITREHPDYFPLVVGNHILGGSGLVSRLSNEVREKRGLSYSVYSYFSPMRVPGPFAMGLQTKNSSRDEALALMRTVLKEYVAKGPEESELEAAKKNITGGFPLRFDTNWKISEQLVSIAYYGLPLTYLEDYTARVSAVTTRQIQEAFSKHIKPQQTVTVIVGGNP